ncbi:MAG TPA: DnaJ domain-containing protein [Pyrinomonadaceae bacterium]|nr:DnaJ domain-containing protein [Pyrinomonadaceae bacterium]
MNGQLSEQPLVELIREISANSLGGRLRLEHDRMKVVAYFNNGNFVYAAANVRTLRLREYLLKSKLVSEQDLAQFNERVSDSDLVKVLCAQKLLSEPAAEQVQARQVADVLRLALVWTEGSWDFDSRSRLTEAPAFKIDTRALLLEASRRFPPAFIASRFQNPAELITPPAAPFEYENLQPSDVFLLSRLDKPMALRDLVAVSGLGETETLSLIYSLALTGVIARENWESAFSGSQPPPPKPPETPAPVIDEEPPKPAEEEDDIESFLQKIKTAASYYDVLGVDAEASPESMKAAYYQLARRYHPDRFGRAEASLLSRVESAFARITQAYETLRDDGLRASYNSKLKARRKAEQLAADSAPKAAAPTAEPVAAGVAEPVIPAAERAEALFKEGLAAVELGQHKVALGFFASASRAVRNEPRYRAAYGEALARDERTRRAAETELLEAIKLAPANAEYRLMLAELYRDLGLKLRAKGEAERAVAADPNNRKARELLRALS